jgi:hypothetical protein
VVLCDGTAASFPEPGARDALCRLIDTTVVSAREVRERDGSARIEVETDAGDRLCVELSGDNESEFAQLIPADAQGRLMPSEMYVW